MKKSLCILLVLAQLLWLAACSESGQETETEANPDAGIAAAAESGQEETSIETEEETEEEILPDLPPMDFGGDAFVFLSRSMTGDWEAANIKDIYAEAITGEGLNDAVFQRNTYMNDTYNVVIEEVKSDRCSDEVRKSVAAADGSLDVAYIAVADSIAHAGSGSFLNYKKLPHIDFEQPWWDTNAAESLEISGKLYGAVNDIMLSNHNATSAVLFNKKMLGDYGFEENPYDLVKEDAWTLDKVAEMSAVVCNDEDGNGKMDENDTYGFMCYRDASLSLFHSSGGRIAKRTEDGGLTLSLMEETTYDALMDSLTLMANTSTFNLHKVLEARHPNDLYSIAEDMFRNDQGLFYWILIHDIQKFRNMESDFGILPVPSSNPSLYGYGSDVNQYHGCLMSVLTTANPEQAGYVLEAMAAKSRYTVQREYYDICLSRKYSRDEDSAEMLDIIFGNRVYDIGAYHQIANYAWDVIYLTMTDSTDVASMYKRSSKVAQKLLDRLVQRYEKMD